MFVLEYSTQLLKQVALLGSGALTTLRIFFLTLLFSLPLGLLIALARMAPYKWLNLPVRFYILIMRGTPLILQLIFFYFAPSAILPEGLRFTLPRFTAAVVAFSLNYAAYFAEIYRGGIESIPLGQYEAAAVLGFTKSQTFFRIILPQVIKRILPPVSNEVITLVKDTALITVLGITELFRVARNEANRLFSTTPLFIAGLFYLFMNWIVTKVFDAAEKKLSYYR
ncbi:MAG TPA: amino acid ABC transporter permease [Firmicutes bacterium]|uniref:Amino acid ABC transporter permease n=1 Tax=Capillibacterium thermochitinicola TaxID=2699427 RepID=A0A8J6LIE0_9FIRM|nr:amino acid ABC transporter permease [Capillibacterium thermochitinicola]MBA2132980.1 amino acid ABC transporter permease [Capillibacterium thermochitinicola]HHW12757.1 amino acid ABC transporter permease [Bacillota bacterium]